MSETSSQRGHRDLIADEDKTGKEEVACPACLFGWEPTQSTTHMFCVAHQEKDEVTP